MLHIIIWIWLKNLAYCLDITWVARSQMKYPSSCIQLLQSGLHESWTDSDALRKSYWNFSAVCLVGKSPWCSAPGSFPPWLVLRRTAARVQANWCTGWVCLWLRRDLHKPLQSLWTCRSSFGPAKRWGSTAGGGMGCGAACGIPLSLWQALLDHSFWGNPLFACHIQIAECFKERLQSVERKTLVFLCGGC